MRPTFQDTELYPQSDLLSQAIRKVQPMVMRATTKEDTTAVVVEMRGGTRIPRGAGIWLIAGPLTHLSANRSLIRPSVLQHCQRDIPF
jgi:hypothetical protein